MSKKPYYITTAITYTSGNLILVTHMRSSWQTVLLDIKEWKAMTYFSRQELTNMARK